jgi:hypothetical protein
VLEVKVALGELFTQPVLKDFAQGVMVARLSQVDADEMAQLLALLADPTVA